MTHRLPTDYAKNYCNRTLTLENVVTCFFLGHSVYIFLDNVLAINVNKYSVTTASCQQRWRTNWIHFRGRAKDCGMSCDYQSQQSSSLWFGQSANHSIC